MSQAFDVAEKLFLVLLKLKEEHSQSSYLFTHRTIESMRRMSHLNRIVINKLSQLPRLDGTHGVHHNYLMPMKTESYCRFVHITHIRSYLIRRISNSCLLANPYVFPNVKDLDQEIVK